MPAQQAEAKDRPCGHRELPAVTLKPASDKPSQQQWRWALTPGAAAACSMGRVCVENKMQSCWHHQCKDRRGSREKDIAQCSKGPWQSALQGQLLHGWQPCYIHPVPLGASTGLQLQPSTNCQMLSTADNLLFSTKPHNFTCGSSAGISHHGSQPQQKDSRTPCRAHGQATHGKFRMSY